MTPAEIEDHLHKHEATIRLLKLIVGDLVAALPDERRASLRQGLDQWARDIRLSQTAPLLPSVEAMMARALEQIAEVTGIIDRPVLSEWAANRAFRPQFGPKPPPETQL